MKTTSLKEYSETKGFSGVARELGITPSGVRLAVESGADIRVVLDDHGSLLSAYKVTAFPSQAAVARGKASKRPSRGDSGTIGAAAPT